MKIKNLVLPLLVSVGMALSFITGAVVHELGQSAEPHCPSEDSCWVDYDGANGRWVIHEEHVDEAPAWVLD